MDICHLKAPFSLKLAPQAVIIVGANEKSHFPPTSCTPPCNLAMQNYVVSGILFLCSWDLSKYFFCIHLLCQKIAPLAICFLCPDSKNVFVNRLLGFSARNVNMCPSLPDWENHSEWQSATGNTILLVMKFLGWCA